MLPQRYVLHPWSKWILQWGYIYVMVECVELAEIVCSYSIKSGDLTAVSGKIMAFWGITICKAGKQVPVLHRNLAIQPSVFLFSPRKNHCVASTSCSPCYLPSHLYVCYLPIWLTVLSWTEAAGFCLFFFFFVFFLVLLSLSFFM